MRVLAIKQVIDTLFPHHGFDSGRYGSVLSLMAEYAGKELPRRYDARAFVDAYGWDKLTDAQVLDIVTLTVNGYSDRCST